MRAARTDKGVHAAGQVVSVKLEIADNDEENAIININKHLPDVIRIIGIMRVPKSFNAKLLCDCRSYEYLLPLNIFDLFISKYKIEEILNKFRDSLSKYIGTHSFHNYTEGKLPGDAKYIIIILELVDILQILNVLIHLH